METKEHHLLSEGLRLGLDIAKLTFKAAAVCAAFMTVKELHKLHKAIEARHQAAK